jgi:hypothetical protein
MPSIVNQPRRKMVIRGGGSMDTLTPFDPIKDSLGKVARRGVTVTGTARSSVVGRGTGAYGTGELPGTPPALRGVRVPSLARRRYLPTLSRLDLQ